MKSENPIIGFKGFDKDTKCRDFQFKEGEVYETNKNPVRCTENGFHFCTEPLDVLAYYSPDSSIYRKVEGYGETDTSNEDSKLAVSKIKIGAEISLFELVKIGVDIIIKRCKKNIKEDTDASSAAVNSGDSSAAVNSGDSSAAVNSGNSSSAVNSGNSSAAVNSGDSSAAVNSGYSSAAVNSGYISAAVNSGYSSAAVNSGNRSAAVNSGDSSAAVNSGNSSAAVNSGYRSAAEVTGENSIACAFGCDNKAKGALGCWLVLTEWIYDNGYKINSLKSVKVDGKRVKANTWYKLTNGKISLAE